MFEHMKIEIMPIKIIESVLHSFYSTTFSFFVPNNNFFTCDIREIDYYQIVALDLDRLLLELTVGLTTFGFGLEIFLYNFPSEPLN